MRNDEPLRAALLAVAAAVLISGAGTAAVRLTANEPGEPAIVVPVDGLSGVTGESQPWGYGGDGRWFWSAGRWRTAPGPEPTIELVVLDGVGHASAVEAPERVTAAIRTFLGRSGP